MSRFYKKLREIQNQSHDKPVENKKTTVNDIKLRPVIERVVPKSAEMPDFSNEKHLFTSPLTVLLIFLVIGGVFMLGMTASSVLLTRNNEIIKMQDAISHQQGQVTTLEQKMSKIDNTLDSRFKSINNELLTVKNDVKDQLAENDKNIKQYIKQASSDLETARIGMAGLKAKLDDLKSKYQQQRDQINDLNQKLDAFNPSASTVN